MRRACVVVLIAITASRVAVADKAAAVAAYDRAKQLVKEGKVKVELGLATHKKLHDKRDAKRQADDQREIDRAIKRGRA
jgi:tmRNA-binding protein